MPLNLGSNFVKTKEKTVAVSAAAVFFCVSIFGKKGEKSDIFSDMDIKRLSRGKFHFQMIGTHGTDLRDEEIGQGDSDLLAEVFDGDGGCFGVFFLCVVLCLGGKLRGDRGHFYLRR